MKTKTEEEEKKPPKTKQQRTIKDNMVRTADYKEK